MADPRRWRRDGIGSAMAAPSSATIVAEILLALEGNTGVGARLAERGKGAPAPGGPVGPRTRAALRCSARGQHHPTRLNHVTRVLSP